MGKHRFAPQTRRFAHLPLGSCMYAAELSNGIVKIGCALNGRGRLMSLANEVKRAFDADLLRFHVVKRPTEIGGRRMEVRTINRLRLMGKQLPGRQEYFEGVTFEQAVRVLDELDCEERDAIVTVTHQRTVPVSERSRIGQKAEE